jgi:hypothetical protein
MNTLFGQLYLFGKGDVGAFPFFTKLEDVGLG